MQIYGIHVHWSESPSTPYLLAASCSKEKLENILKNSIKHDCNCTYTIEQVDLYVVSKCKDGNILFHKLAYYDEEFVKNKMYGMNICSSTSVKQVLLKILHDNEEYSEEYQLFVEELRKHKLFIDDNFSTGTIQFDEYYEEGVLNA